MTIYLTRRQKRNLKRKTRKYFGGTGDEDDEKMPNSFKKSSRNFNSKASINPSDEIIEIKKKLIDLREQRVETDNKIMHLEVISLVDNDDNLQEELRNLQEKFRELSEIINKYEKELKSILQIEDGLTERLEEAKDRNIDSIANRITNIKKIEDIQSLRETLKSAVNLLEKQRKELLEIDPYANVNFAKFDELFRY